jgi:glycosyltransferase involved in cell wall biosynthesis
MATKTNILLFQRIMPAYRIPVFKELYRRFGVFTCYSDEKKGQSLKSENKGVDFPAEKMKRIYFGSSPTRVLQNIIKPLNKYKPEVVISEGSPSFLSLWILMLLKSLYDYKLIVWTHGIKNNEVHKPFSSRASKLALKIMKKADAVILYSDERKIILEKYINHPEKLFVANNTLDTAQYELLLNKFDEQGKVSIKQELGWNARCNLIFIGRLLTSKRLDVLIDAFKLLPETTDVHLHIIGDGPDKEKLEKEAAKDARIKLYGALYDDEITGKYLYASDIMIMPGYVGLSVIHAFAYGCPVISCKTNETTGPFHSPEIEYLKEDLNGYLLDLKPAIIAGEILFLLQHPAKLEKMSKAALKTAYKEATIDKMMQGFEKAIKYVNAFP